MPRTLCCIALIAGTAVSVAHAQRTLRVPQDYREISEAVSAAQDGDTVLVDTGSYVGFKFEGKAITVRSVNGPHYTVISARGTIVTFWEGEGAGSVLEGFRITGSTSGDGGGILCTDGSSPTIRRCLITENIARFAGGGIYCSRGSSPTIEDCVISGNTSVGNSRWEGNGGGIACIDGSNPTLLRCTITNNASENSYPDRGGGGGVYCRDGSSPTIRSCVISGNRALGEERRGGGIYCDDESSPRIFDSIITYNSSEGGGGFYCRIDGSRPTLTDCVVSDNIARLVAGGLFFSQYTESVVTNCLIVRNTVVDGFGDQSGAGAYCSSAKVTFENCTIADNVGPTGGGGIFHASSSVNVVDSILWNNSPDEIDGPNDWIGVTYSDVKGGWPGEGNIDEDPLFVAEAGDEYFLSQRASGQNRTSPCVDAGSDTAKNLGRDQSTTRTDRVADGNQVDMGYHHPLSPRGRELHVPRDHSTIQAALDEAETLDTVSWPTANTRAPATRICRSAARQSRCAARAAHPTVSSSAVRGKRASSSWMASRP